MDLKYRYIKRPCLRLQYHEKDIRTGNEQDEVIIFFPNYFLQKFFRTSIKGTKHSIKRKTYLMANKRVPLYFF